MEDYIVKLIPLSVVGWATLFLAFRMLLPKRSFDFCNRLVSTVHAILGVALASLSVQDWSCPVCPLASQSSPKQMQTIAVSVGYLIYDLVCCQFDKQVKIDNSVHHLVSIIGGVAGLVYQRCGTEMVAALIITEISSPFLHLREFLKELGYRGTDLNLAADVAFAVVFSFARMTGGPYLTYVTLSAPNPLLIKVPMKSTSSVEHFDVNFKEVIGMMEWGKEWNDHSYLHSIPLLVISIWNGMTIPLIITIPFHRGMTIPCITMAMALGLQLVSAFWFYKIVRMVIYKFSTRSTREKTQ